MTFLKIIPQDIGKKFEIGNVHKICFPMVDNTWTLANFAFLPKFWGIFTGRGRF